MNKYTLDRIENINGTIVRNVYRVREFAKKEKKEFLCYRQTENNMNFCRNIYVSYINRLYICEPGYKNRWGYMIDEEEWAETSKDCQRVLPLPLDFYEAQKRDYETVYEKYPDFKNVVKILKKGRSNVTNHILIASLYLYNRYRQKFVDILDTKSHIIAFDMKFYDLKDDMQKKIITFVKNYHQTSRQLSKIKILMKLKEKFPKYRVNFLYDIYYKKWNYYNDRTDRNANLEFFHNTDEWKKACEKRRKEFDELYLDKEKIREEITYTKFKSLMKKAKKFDMDSLYDLYELQAGYKNPSWYVHFLARYNNDFIYTVKKAEMNGYYIHDEKHADKLLTVWKKYGYETEMLMGCGLAHIVINDNYYELSGETRKQIKDFICKNRSFINAFNSRLHYDDILDLIKFNTNDFAELSYIYDNFYYVKDLDKDQIRYLMKNPKIQADEYKSYCGKVTFCGHDIKDDYWRKPKQFKARFKKVTAEKQNIEQYFDEHKGEIYAAYIKRFTDKISKTVIDGLEIFIPEDIGIIQSQADTLKQCLIRLDYPKKVINGNCILIFVFKDNLPYATCEIAHNKIVQFRGMNNDPMNTKEYNTMNKWLCANNQYLEAAA